MKKTALISLVLLTLGCNESTKAPDGGKPVVKSDRAQGSYQPADRIKYSRAVEAAIWGMPIVATDAIRQGYLRDMQANYNDIVYYSRPADWTFQTTTPNASTHYIYCAYDTKKEGPIVLEVPVVTGAGLYGQLCNMWDIPLTIVGPGGDDQGKGAKYLILPPGYKEKTPAGYLPVQQDTYGGFWLMRTIAKSNAAADQEAANALLKKIRVYPLSKAKSPPEQRFIDASTAGKVWDGIPKMDETFYTVLAKMINEEPVLPQDGAMMNMLRSVGIVKGKEFNPDDSTKLLLSNAAREAKDFFQRTLINQLVPYWDNAHWALPDASGLKTEFTYLTPGFFDYDNRGMLGFYGWAPPKKADASAPTIYLQTLLDKDGQLLEGDKTYKLRVPANAPARQYWSVTIYDAETAGFIREAKVVSLDSYNQQTKKNEDGSIDIYFAPVAPQGWENNWVSTAKGGNWFPIFRLYGPEKPFFDKTWKMGDIENVRP